MHHDLLQILVLLFSVMLLVMLAKQIKVAYPIFLVISGLAINFIPGTPVIHLDPDLIFLIFLPPLLYEAAWYTSWKDFWKWKFAIALLAFGLVFFTSTVIAFSSSMIIPGFTLAIGFLLGGIISPPDAVAAASVLKGMKVPKRLLTILEGESLVNDASSLIVFKFALAAILTGSFSMQEASLQFFLIAGIGIVIGLIGANIMYLIHRFLPTTPAIDGALTILTPYILYLAAEQFQYSGVMAVVSGGLFMSYRAHEIFKSGTTRLNMLGVWTTMIFVMNAVVFILIGLELPEIINGLGNYSVSEAIKYGLIISVITILLRFLWVYPGIFIPRWISAKARRDPSPGWKGALVIAWAGMRGVVSLATALSIPMFMTDKLTPFPERNLIIFITFIVIFITLVFQGLTLPLVLRLIKIEEFDPVAPEEEQRMHIQLRLNKVALHELNAKYQDKISENHFLKLYKEGLERQENNIKKSLESLGVKETELKTLALYHEILIDIFTAQRKELFKLRKEKFFSDEEIRKSELQLDLDEMKIIGKEE